MVKSFLKQSLLDKFPDTDFDVLIPPDDQMGDYSINLAFMLAKKENVNPRKIGEELVAKFLQDKDFEKYFSKIELAGAGFINFYLSDDFLRKQLSEITQDDNYGFNETMKDKTVMVEYTDPNPFKLFHIGHLMSNAIGETISRLYEASGAKVLRANYQGDLGLHVAMAVWGMRWMPDESNQRTMPDERATPEDKVNFLGEAYVLGSGFYKTGGKEDIEEINKHIFEKDDPKINELYDKGKKWSLEYFETIYKKLGTKFDRYFFESEVASDGLNIIKEHPEVFVESEGAMVFKGEEYGLHTRVFINSKGLPTYESKELGLNKNKFKKDNLDLSIIITSNEIDEYFKVLLKVMELTMPEVAAKTKHISHGILRLPSGKMSSRTGDVITANSLIEQTKDKLPDADPEIKEKVAIGAIKYSILKQSPGHDIIFDFEKSLSIKGDSGPYLQYAYARLNSIISKASQQSIENSSATLEYLTDPTEIKLIKRLLTFSDVVTESSEKIFPQYLALYLYELANDANRFYELVRVLEDENTERRNTRLMLVRTVAAVLKRGLNILGLSVLEKI